MNFTWMRSRFTIYRDGFIREGGRLVRNFHPSVKLNLCEYREWVHRMRVRLKRKGLSLTREDPSPSVEEASAQTNRIVDLEEVDIKRFTELSELGWTLRSDRTITEDQVTRFFRYHGDIGSWVLQIARRLHLAYPELDVNHITNTLITIVLLGREWFVRIQSDLSLVNWVEEEMQLSSEGSPLDLERIIKLAI